MAADRSIVFYQARLKTTRGEAEVLDWISGNKRPEDCPRLQEAILGYDMLRKRYGIPKVRILEAMGGKISVRRLDYLVRLLSKKNPEPIEQCEGFEAVTYCNFYKAIMSLQFAYPKTSVLSSITDERTLKRIRKGIQGLATELGINIPNDDALHVIEDALLDVMQIISSRANRHYETPAQLASELSWQTVRTAHNLDAPDEDQLHSGLYYERHIGSRIGMQIRLNPS